MNSPETSLEEFFDDLLQGRHDNTKNLMMITRLKAIKNDLITAEMHYQELGDNNLLHTIKEIDEIVIPVDAHLDKDVPRLVSDREMEKVYTNFFVDKPNSKKIGRRIYERILANAYYNLCPYCSQREVKTLDHYLPKSKFITYTITPVNLLPSCSDCNKLKLDNYTPSESKMIIHPYFEDLSHEKWLGCNVVENIWPITFSYSISNDVEDSILHSRLKYHFELFELSELYADNASREFNNRLKSLIKEYDSDPGKKALEFLKDNLESYEAENQNSWQTKMFDALINSKWFLEEALPRLSINYKK